MKITNVKIERFQVPLSEAFRVTFLVIDKMDNWIVQIETDEGIYGLGSAAPLPFVTGETTESCYEILKLFATGLIGRDPMDIAGAHQMMDSLIAGNGSAKCAIDIALYDIIGKKLGKPVYQVLGGESGQVHNDITIGIDAPEKMAENADVLVHQKGFDILKVKIGLDLQSDIEALNLIRQKVGDRVRIRVDANQGYTVDTALKALDAFRTIGIDAMEQALPAWDFDGAAELMKCNKSGVALMLDESIHTVHDARRAAEHHCGDYFNIKLMKCGGLYHGAQIADIAEEHGLYCMVGCMLENKISITAGVSLVAAKKSIVEADCDSFMLLAGGDDGIAGGFERNGGQFHLLDKPGLGIDLKL